MGTLSKARGAEVVTVPADRLAAGWAATGEAFLRDLVSGIDSDRSLELVYLLGLDRPAPEEDDADLLTRMFALPAAVARVLAARGKGEHNLRSGTEPSVSARFTNVQIEAIVGDRATAERIADTVGAKYFKNYAVIVYLTQVEVLRASKFVVG